MPAACAAGECDRIDGITCGPDLCDIAAGIYVPTAPATSPSTPGIPRCRPALEAVTAAEALLAAKEASPVRATVRAHGAYYEKWLAASGCGPGDHAEIEALRILLADREATIRELLGRR
jgi:hypothetical protein